MFVKLKSALELIFLVFCEEGCQHAGRNFHILVYCATIHNSEDIDIFKVPNNIWISEKCDNAHKEILLSSKEGNCVIFRKMDEIGDFLEGPF